MNKKWYLLPALFCIVVLLTCISQCNKRHESGTSAICRQENIALIKGTPDTSKTYKAVKGSLKLRKVLTLDSTSVYTGVINDSSASITITARLMMDSTMIDLDFAGAIAEKVISQTDTLLHNTLEIREADSPWYDSFAIGIITGEVLFIIYLIIHSSQ